MAYIGKKPEDLIRGNATYNSFTGDGSTTAFDVTNILPDGGDYDVEVFVDNVRQEAGASKSYTIGNDGSGDRKRITFNVAPDNASEIYVINPGRETSLINVADNTVSAAKIQSDAVTTAKVLDSNITTAKIAADAITGAKLADDAVDSEHLTDGSVDNVHLANSSITINGTAVSLGGSVTAGTDWQAVTVADGSTQLTAEAGKGYFLDTNAGVIEVFLPSSPTRGDTVVLADYASNFATNNVIVNTGGELIDSVQPNFGGGGYTLSTNNLVVELVYVDSSKGWLVKENEAKNSLTAQVDPNINYILATGGTVTTSGNYKIHTFTGDGNFIVSSLGSNIPCAQASTVDYLVVAGGGGGGGSPGGNTGAGGGAGGFRESHSTPVSGCYTASPLATPTGITVTATTYPITVGGGGAGGPGAGENKGCSGSNSVFSTITSAGGGGGGAGSPSSPGKNGGSGGGGGGGSTFPNNAGGSGNTPPTSPPQGQNGGSARPNTGPTYDSAAGGGGGAGGAGGPSPNGSTGGAGGAHVNSSITNSDVEYAGGAGGGTNRPCGSRGTPGGGGAGCSANSSTGTGTAGTSNTGGGGGGSRDGNNAGAGGKGIVIIRYQFQAS